MLKESVGFDRTYRAKSHVFCWMDSKWRIWTESLWPEWHFLLLVSRFVRYKLKLFNFYGTNSECFLFDLLPRNCSDLVNLSWIDIGSYSRLAEHLHMLHNQIWSRDCVPGRCLGSHLKWLDYHYSNFVMMTLKDDIGSIISK